MASRLAVTTSFPRVFFQLLQFSRQRPSFSAHRATLMTNWLEFSNIFFKICRFRSSILLSRWVFIPRGAMLESGLTEAWFSWTNHNSLRRIATNEIASFCIDNRSHQMAFFSCSPKRAKAGFRVMLKYFEINKSFMCSSLFRYYIKQIESMLPCVCSVIDHRWRQNVVRTSAIALCATFILTTFWRHLWSITEQTHSSMESVC